MFRVGLLCEDLDGVWCFDMRARYTRASTLPHREWLSLYMYKRDTYREYILLSSQKEKDTKRETDIYLILENIVLYFQDLMCSIVFLKNKSCSFWNWSIQVYIDIGIASKESDGYAKFIKYRLVYLLVLWKHKRMILCARKMLRSVGPALLFSSSYIFLYIYIYLCLTSLRSVLFLASLATLVLFFLHLLLILIYFAYIFRNQRRCSYSEI